MQIAQSRAEGFASLSVAEVTFPDRGIVVVTGANGSGKSSLIETVAWCLWGETLRGAPPTHEGEATTATIVVGTTVVTRRRLKTRTTLDVSDPEPLRFESVTKAQEWIVAAFGSFDSWRRAHVFSSQDAAHFSAATDAEKKTLIEEIAGLTKFDGAHDRARKDLAAASSKAQGAEADRRVCETRAAEAKRRLASAQSLLDHAQQTKTETSTPDMPIVDTLQLTQEVARTGAAENEARRRESAVQAKVDAAKRTLAQLSGRDACPLCGNNLHKADAAAHLAVLRASIVEDTKAANVAFNENHSAREAHAAAVKAFDRAVRANAEAKAHNEKQRSMREFFAPLIAKHEAEIAAETEAKKDAESALAKSVADLASFGARVRIMTRVVEALSPKGARAILLRDTLAALTALANEYLSRLSSDIRINIAATTTTRAGAVRETIAIDVIGAGGGHGYAGASAGERRRIDVAILLALSEFGAAARGGSRGTMFFDEVFDSLDGEGVESVGEILREIAQDRVVVVITHAALVRNVLSDAAARLTVANGEVVCE